ncbi:MAG: hypothetical protein M3294_00475 [Pseudomonadota bacterium]|nr:hypothetical protein [Pseudomonadota bacterium]
MGVFCDKIERAATFGELVVEASEFDRRERGADAFRPQSRKCPNALPSVHPPPDATALYVSRCH